jgi:hypothetical protein
MNTILTMAEIVAQFDNEWVLIDEPITNEAMEVLGGNVLYHSRDRHEFDRKSLEFKSKRSAIMFLGKPQADMEFIL